METIFLIGRILLGGYFIYNAYGHFTHMKSMAAYAKSKGVPMPEFGVILSGVMLLVGGFSILTGILLMPGLWMLAVFLVVVSLMMHAFWKIPDNMALRMNEQINFTKNMALLGAILMMIAMVAY